MGVADRRIRGGPSDPSFNGDRYGRRSNRGGGSGGSGGSGG